VRIAFVHFPGRIARLEAARAGEAPTEFLFGAVELERAGHHVVHHEVDPARVSGPVTRRAIDLQAGAGRLPPHLSATVLAQTRLLLPALRRADVVVATTTGTAVALAVWRKLGRLRRPLVGIVAGLVNRPWSRARRTTTLPLLRAMDAVLYGDGELARTLALHPSLAGRVHVDRFGVDTGWWTPETSSVTGEGVLAIGNDGNRDWSTMLAAAPSIAAPLRIFTKHDPPERLPDNVTWHAADWHRALLSDSDVRRLYRDAAVVVVPVRDVPQPSGQSVTLQAMACGRPVVLTETRGLWAPASLRDGENVAFVPPADPAALASAVSRLLADPELARSLGGAARAHVVADGGIEGYANRLLAICDLASRRS